MAQSLAQNAIALLIELTERGEIDPWDVKVIDVVDRFLQQLRPEQRNGMGRETYEADLLESGQAFLYAAMLVLLKADSLVRDAEQATEEQVDELEELFPGDDGEAVLPPNLERRIRRRAIASPPQSRPVTLPELIQQ
ncbi:MAG: segregation/condensation protein A, partial [Symploca sp. SIO3C6]|nr:segregation/condensation protein A [Symploca sp. SIO3C6]